MVFTTPIFLFYFLPLVLLAYYGLPQRVRNPLLTLASYLFYGWWSPWFVSLMLFSTVVDWFCGLAVTAEGASATQRKGAVLTSVLVNLSLLGFFKYFMFAQENLNRLREAFGAQGLPVLQVVLPVGISFYTFQSMSYSIDLYRGHARRARGFADFACYVAMFPQLIAGPIVRYRDLAEQLHSRPQRGQLIAEGALHFMIGFAKKVLLANSVASIVDLTFDGGPLSAPLAWFGIVAYAFQIYFDFSGYSDMAIGLGLMLGFRFPTNFRSPYRADSITDFWRRWHISLSSWLRDYLYIPLGGNRRGRARTYVNLFLTMLLGGLWHGAQWTFVGWGALHGGALAIERMLGKGAAYQRWPRPLRVLLTFVIVLVGWVFFRAESLGQALHYLAVMFGAGQAGAGAAVAAGRAYTPFSLMVMGLAAAVVWWGRETPALVERARRAPALGVGVYAAFVLGVVVMFAQAENPFLYFQF